MYKKLIFRYWSIIVLILETFPMIQGYFDVPDFAVMLSVVGIGFVFYPRSFFNKTSLFFFLFIMIITIGINLKSFDLQWYLVIIIYWLFSLTLINVFLYNKDWLGCKVFLIVGMTILLVSSLISIVHSVNEADMVRQFVLYSSEQDAVGVKIGQKLGIANYGMVHGIPTLLPALVYLFKKEKNIFRKIVWLSLLFIFYYLILVSGFGTALILSTFILIISFLISENKRKNYILFGVFLLIGAFFLNKDFVINFLDTVKIYFENSAIYDKIIDIQYSIKTNDFEGQLNTRGSLYTDSWNTFFQYPIFGSSEHSDAGGHLFIADYLAWFGLAGAIPLLLFFYFAFKRIYLIINDSQRIYYLLALLPFIMLSFLKATPFFEQVLYVLVFIPAIFLLKRNSNKAIS